MKWKISRDGGRRFSVTDSGIRSVHIAMMRHNGITRCAIVIKAILKTIGESIVRNVENEFMRMSIGL